MKKIAILLLTILLANPVYSMKQNDNKKQKNNSVLKIDIDNDGIEDIIVDGKETKIDLDGDGITDITIKNSTIKKLSKYFLITAISTYGIDLTGKILGIETDLYTFGELTEITVIFLMELIKTHGPKIISMIKNNLSDFIEEFKELRAAMQTEGNL